MSGGLISVLWLCGPPGVGKTTVGWEIYSRLRQAGSAVGFVDVDQLGVCRPDPVSDPGRHRIMARNLGVILSNFRASGVRCVVASGVVDVAVGVHAEYLPQAALTVCRLRADREELTRRLLGRGGVDLVERVLRNADALDASAFADICVDTTGATVAEVVRRVLEQAGGRTASSGRRRRSATAETGEATAAVDGPILWLCGATGVGKSTAGFALYRRTARDGIPVAFLDVDQVGFHSPSSDDPDGHRVKARNLAGLWRNYRAAGAERLIVVGALQDQATVKIYTDLLPSAALRVCRLHAGRDQLTRRIMLRGEGGGWPQPGDPLKGRPTAHLLDIAAEAAASAGALDRAGIGDTCIDTDDHTIEETVEAIQARTGWWQH